MHTYKLRTLENDNCKTWVFRSQRIIAHCFLWSTVAFGTFALGALCSSIICEKFLSVCWNRIYAYCLSEWRNAKTRNTESDLCVWVLFYSCCLWVRQALQTYKCGSGAKKWHPWRSLVGISKLWNELRHLFLNLNEIIFQRALDGLHRQYCTNILP